MNLVFNDSQKVEIQSFEELDGVLNIKVINLSQEELEHLFNSEFATKKMQADSSVFENYTTFVSITKYTGGIFEVCMQQKEKGPTARLKEAESEITILKQEISAKEAEIKKLTSTTDELTSTTNELVLAIAESIGVGRVLNLKLKIMLRAFKIRLEVGEDIKAILDSYPRLTEDEKKQILAELEVESV